MMPGPSLCRGRELCWQLLSNPQTQLKVGRMPWRCGARRVGSCLPARRGSWTVLIYLDPPHLSASWLLFFVRSTVKRKTNKQKKPQNLLRVSANTNLIIPAIAQIQSDLIPSKGGARPPLTLCREAEGGQAPGVPGPLCPRPTSVEVQASS